MSNRNAPPRRAPVLTLVPRDNSHTVAMLKCLLRRAIDGEVNDMVMCLRTKEGAEEAAFTGRYKSDPAHGVSAALRLSMKLARLQDEADHA